MYVYSSEQAAEDFRLQTGFLSEFTAGQAREPSSRKPVHPAGVHASCTDPGTTRAHSNYVLRTPQSALQAQPFFASYARLRWAAFMPL